MKKINQFDPTSIPEGWALVNLDDLTIVPHVASPEMLAVGWPLGEIMYGNFDAAGAYSDLTAAFRADGEGIIHGTGRPMS